MRWLALVLVLSACGDDDRPGRDGGGIDASGDAIVEDTLNPPDVPGTDSDIDADDGCNDPLDVVFVIDTSTSMEDELDQIANGVTSVWNAARALTTDTQFGLVVFVDDVVAVNGCASFDTVESLQAELMSWRDFTSTNRQPAGGGADSNSDCPENSLDAFWAAATQCPWRPSATKLIIHATDDTFAERGASLSGIPVERMYSEVAGVLVSNELRVGTFAAPGAGEFCGAGTSPNVGQGFHEPFMGMDTLPNQTGGQAWSIRDVRAGTLDMATAITTLISEEYCEPFLE